MRIPCPHCGSRDVAEFVCRGQVSEDLHLRDNPAGPVAEHWYHAQGCRQWLVVTRDTRNHEILAVQYPGEGRGPDPTLLLDPGLRRGTQGEAR